MMLHKAVVTKDAINRVVTVSTPPPAPPAPAQLLPNLRNPLKIFAGISKHLPVFLLGTSIVVGGVVIVVVVCGKNVGEMWKLENKLVW